MHPRNPIFYTIFRVLNSFLNVNVFYVSIPQIYNFYIIYNIFKKCLIGRIHPIRHLPEEFVFYDEKHPWDEKELYFHSVSYQAASWSRPRRVCIRSIREASELLFSHAFIVTSFSEKFPQKEFLKNTSVKGEVCPKFEFIK